MSRFALGESAPLFQQLEKVNHFCQQLISIAESAATKEQRDEHKTV